MRSIGHRHASSILCTLQLVVNDATEAEGRPTLHAGIARESAAVSSNHISLGLCADASAEIVARDTGSAGSINWRESGAGSGDIDTNSAVEELPAVADNALNACVVDH